MPIDDEKNAHCKPFNYVELTDVDGEYIGLFRIIPALAYVQAANEAYVKRIEELEEKLKELKGGAE